MAKGFGVSPITNVIYYGTQNEKTHTWTGKKEDVTNEAIAAVFEWFMGNMTTIKEDGTEVEKQSYSITYEGTDFELTMTRKDSKAKTPDSNENT